MTDYTDQVNRDIDKNLKNGIQFYVYGDTHHKYLLNQIKIYKYKVSVKKLHYAKWEWPYWIVIPE